MLYVRFENAVRENPSIELLSTLGTSASRGSENKIGQFGTGTLNGFCCFARDRLSWKLCLGKDVYTPVIEDRILRDSQGNKHFDEFLSLKKQNGGKKDLNISVQMGAMDWPYLSMGVREIISNALDGAESFDGTYSTFKMDVVPESECRAKDGTIRFYLPLTQEVAEYLKDLKTNFICLNDDYDPNAKILPNDSGPCKMYRKGVLVGKYGQHSLFNYNLPDVKINDCRTVDTSMAITSACSALLKNASLNDANLFVRNVLINKSERELFESRFSQWDMDIANNYGSHKNNNWKEAILSCMGNSVLVSNETEKDLVESRGYNTITVKEGFKSTFQDLGAKTPDKVLNYHDLNGREIVPSNDNTRNFLDKVWDIIGQFNMTGGKDKPKLATFVQNTLSEGAAAGFYHDGTVYIRKDYEDDKGMNIVKIMVEECAHYVTGATDGSRDFQEYAMRLTANMITFLI